MHTRQRFPSPFDRHSVMFFAALCLGGTSALQAQARAPGQSPSLPESSTPYGPGAGRPSTAATTAFQRADTDQDGMLSETEAERLPAISQRFRALDADRNGLLSRREFDKGLLP